jgi:C-terminal processing protease CtpA/Prc
LLPPYAWPFSLRKSVEGLVVDSPDPSSGMRRGDLVISVEGVPIADLLRAGLPKVFASTDVGRENHAILMLRSSDQRQGTFVIERSGERLSVNVSAIERAKALNPDAPSISWSILPGEIGYIRVRSFATRDQKAWLAALPEDRERVAEPELRAIHDAMDAVSRTTGLVLDLRGNLGGTDLLGMELARRLVRPGAVYYSLSSKANGLWSPPAPNQLPVPHSQLRMPAQTAYTGPLAILIDEGSFSATDNFVACVRDNRPNTVVVGRPTGGGTGAPRAFRLPKTGSTVAFCTMRVYRPGGGLIDGRGTIPDVQVNWSRSSYETGVDPDIDAARAWLIRQASQSP